MTTVPPTQQQEPRPPLSSVNQSLVELVYSKYAGQYSRDNWISSVPLWTELSTDRQDFWKDIVLGIRTGFRRDISVSQRPLSEEPTY